MIVSEDPMCTYFILSSTNFHENVSLLVLNTYRLLGLQLIIGCALVTGTDEPDPMCLASARHRQRSIYIKGPKHPRSVYLPSLYPCI